MIIQSKTLEQAMAAVTGVRRESYGHPFTDFSKVTQMAMALWGRGPQTPREHAMYMILVKLARESCHHSQDNLIDIAGYAATLEMVVDMEEEIHEQTHSVLGRANY